MQERLQVLKKNQVAFNLTVWLLAIGFVQSHPHDGVHPHTSTPRHTILETNQIPPATSGQGDLKFRVVFTGSHLPPDAISVLNSAHGGFAIDRREGKGQVYFALPGAGIIKISADLQSTKLLESSTLIKNANMHNTTIWYDQDGTPFLTFPGNSVGQIFTTTLDGELVHTLPAPDSEDDFDHPTVNSYFGSGRKFAPTDVDYLNHRLYVATGYSTLDYVLTASVESTNPMSIQWASLVFGGRGDRPGQLMKGHGITVSPNQRRIDVADRSVSEIDRFTPLGHYRSTWHLPSGAYPCDIDYHKDLAIVGCLHGPDRSKGAPIYLLRDGAVVSTVMPKEDLGLENFQHIHNAVLHEVKGKLYIIAQAWNPGDFAILEQTSP